MASYRWSTAAPASYRHLFSLRAGSRVLVSPYDPFSGHCRGYSIGLAKLRLWKKLLKPLSLR